MSFRSTILAIDTAAGILTLDELSPRRGHERFVSTGRARVTGTVQGIPVRFTALLERVSIENGIACYAIRRPGEIHYAQRRQYYRVPIGAGLAGVVWARVTLEDGAAVNSEIRDVSFGGAGLWLPQDTPLCTGAQLYHCVFHLADDEDLICKAVVRYAFEEARTSRPCLRIGVRFEDVSTQTLAVIRRCVAALERKRMRQRNNI